MLDHVSLGVSDIERSAISMTRHCGRWGWYGLSISATDEVRTTVQRLAQQAFNLQLRERSLLLCRPPEVIFAFARPIARRFVPVRLLRDRHRNRTVERAWSDSKLLIEVHVGRNLSLTNAGARERFGSRHRVFEKIMPHAHTILTLPAQGCAAE
jgi:hypothetical protein